MYEIGTLKKGCELYRGQPTPEIDLKANFHNPDITNQNWNDSLYFMLKKEHAIEYYGKCAVQLDSVNWEERYNYIIECTLCQNLSIIYSDEFGKGKDPFIEEIVRGTNEVLKNVGCREIAYPSHGAKEENFPFMRKLGNRGYAFCCNERADEDGDKLKDIIEVIIPEPVLKRPNLFTQISCYPPYYK